MGTTTAPRRQAPLVARTQREQNDRQPLLAARDLHHGYSLGTRTVPVLRGVDVDVRRGEVVAVVGRSGSGKSTLMHLAGGLTTPQQGEVWLDGVALSSMSPRTRAIARRERVGFVFQAFHLLPGLDLLENVAMPLLLGGEPRPRARERAHRMLDAVGIADRGQHRPSELSGGELQRAAIARALVTDPSLVLADEPTGNLDSATAADVIDLLVDRVRTAGVAMMLVTHDSAIAAHADRVLTMTDGLLT